MQVNILIKYLLIISAEDRSIDIQKLFDKFIDKVIVANAPEYLQAMQCL